MEEQKAKVNPSSIFNNAYVPGSSHMVDYAIEHYSTEVISVEDRPFKQLPFPGLTGASNTNE
jgi:hypothetical protein